MLTWEDTGVRALFHERRLERAIGVIYLPESERLSHYFHASLPAQFDAVLHFDQTRAVEPLDRSPMWTDEEPPETFPTGPDSWLKPRGLTHISTGRESSLRFRYERQRMTTP